MSMPYCARDPPSHHSAADQLPPGPSSFAIEGESSAEILHFTPFRLWRSQGTALMTTCTLLMILTVALSSYYADALPTDARELSCALRDPGSTDKLPAVESRELSGWPSTSHDSNKKSHELALRRTNGYAVEHRQSRNRGLMGMHKLQSVLNYNGSQEGPAKLSRNSHRRRQRVRTGGTFSGRRRRIILVSSVCTNKDISIFQSPDGSSGIPRFTVQIMNNCMSDCPPSDIHVFCGWFASALLVNPNSFKRIAYDDCLVNGGKPLRHGETLRFTYANSFMYPLRFKSASFCK